MGSKHTEAGRFQFLVKHSRHEALHTSVTQLDVHVNSVMNHVVEIQALQMTSPLWACPRCAAFKLWNNGGSSPLSEAVLSFFTSLFFFSS